MILSILYALTRTGASMMSEFDPLYTDTTCPCRWDNAAQVFKIPEELARMLMMFLYTAHHVHSPQSPFVFTNGKNQPFEEAANLTYYWSRIAKRIGLPASLPPQRSALAFLIHDTTDIRIA